MIFLLILSYIFFAASTLFCYAVWNPEDQGESIIIGLIWPLSLFLLLAWLLGRFVGRRLP